MTRSPKVLVAGAGISGLSAAHALWKRDPAVELSIVEERSRVGGNIWTVREQGYLIDAGPDSFLRTKTEAAALCREVELGHSLISPNEDGRRVFVAHRGKLVPMPAGMALAVPTRIGPMVSTPLLSWWGKLRVLGDLAVPTPPGDPCDETVASFLKRHFGPEATDNVAGPLLGGIFAGDIDELSIQSTFPQLVELERRHGSLIRAFFAAERARAAQTNPERKLGAALDDPLYLPDWLDFVRWLYRQGRHAESPFQSLRGGMGELVEALKSRLPAGSIKLDISLLRIERASEKWRAQFSDGTASEFDGVVLCLPAHAAARVLAGFDVAKDLAEIPYVSTATVFFALEQTKLPRALDASGYIVPRAEGRALASTWVSSKWSERAPTGGALVRVFLGGAREPKLVATSSEDDLALLARQELERMIGPLAAVQFVRVFKHVKTNPQPVVGHNARLARIESHMADLPGLVYCSSAMGGVGIPDCIRRASAAAERVLECARNHG